MGIEPIFFAWKAKDLPLIYVRMLFSLNCSALLCTTKVLGTNIVLNSGKQHPALCQRHFCFIFGKKQRHYMHQRPCASNNRGYSQLIRRIRKARPALAT